MMSDVLAVVILHIVREIYDIGDDTNLLFGIITAIVWCGTHLYIIAGS